MAFFAGSEQFKIKEIKTNIIMDIIAFFSKKLFFAELCYAWSFRG